VLGLFLFVAQTVTTSVLAIVSIYWWDLVENRNEMRDKSSPTEYVAALCHMRKGALEPYDTDRFFAVDNAEAIQKATVWRVTAASTIDEQTWLQVLLNRCSIYSEDLGGF
jgi:hypothetical protein